MVQLFKIKKRVICLIKWFLIVFLTTLILDLYLFYFHGFTFNPINQWCFVVFYPPHDYYIPEKIIPIAKDKYIYEFEYEHRYSGVHMISLNIVPEDGYNEDFFQFSNNGIEIDVTVLHPTMETHNTRWICNKKIHYMGGDISLPILKYKNNNTFFDSTRYKVILQIKGPINELIQKHPKSYWGVCNITNK